MCLLLVSRGLKLDDVAFGCCRLPPAIAKHIAVLFVALLHLSVSAIVGLYVFVGVIIVIINLPRSHHQVSNHSMIVTKIVTYIDNCIVFNYMSYALNAQINKKLFYIWWMKYTEIRESLQCTGVVVSDYRILWIAQTRLLQILLLLGMRVMERS